MRPYEHLIANLEVSMPLVDMAIVQFLVPVQLLFRLFDSGVSELGRPCQQLVT
jgi:hypothetical protein